MMLEEAVGRLLVGPQPPGFFVTMWINVPYRFHSIKNCIIQEHRAAQ